MRFAGGDIGHQSAPELNLKEKELSCPQIRTPGSLKVPPRPQKKFEAKGQIQSGTE